MNEINENDFRFRDISVHVEMGYLETYCVTDEVRLHTFLNNFD